MLQVWSSTIVLSQYWEWQAAYQLNLCGTLTLQTDRRTENSFLMASMQTASSDYWTKSSSWKVTFAFVETLTGEPNEGTTQLVFNGITHEGWACSTGTSYSNVVSPHESYVYNCKALSVLQICKTVSTDLAKLYWFYSDEYSTGSSCDDLEADFTAFDLSTIYFVSIRQRFIFSMSIFFLSTKEY